MLAYEIHVTGDAARADSERVRALLERACEEPVDPAVPMDGGQILLVPGGVEWSFERLRSVVAKLRDVASDGSEVTFRGQPDDQADLVRALVRQAAVLAAQGRVPRARTLLRQALPLAVEGDRADVEHALGELGE